MKTRRVVLSDVAAEAGVSTTTASYILNGRADEMRIASETEERVRAAVARLGYRPNRSARSLRTRRTATVGLVSDQIAGEQYGSSMLTGASLAARELDHLVVMGESGGDPELERLLIEEMLEREVDGVVYATRTARTVHLPEALRGTRSVLLNCEDPDRTLPAVVPDDEGGGRQAAAVLLDAGVDDVWVVGEDPTPEATAGPRRMWGVRAGLAASGVALGGVVACDWSVTEGFEATSRWLAEGHRARGLVCMNDRVAMGVYQALAEAGLRVPDDVSVVSFDGSALAGWLRPVLTSVELPFTELGALAVRRLLDADDRGGTVSVPMTVRHGGSVRRA
ncbi:LacI family DNA-binding transcriptional regulator [Microbacterium sp. ARD31]|uniref:LacI family DNA-binding transcriptional regulator n=1 Tax=Microbacterium sp. ARD31 TaxID=2962576 RepID=UPI00288116B6|nr:LacI family DNA-binding transcriptional regulator [Microbacterium sp. ARD31]MDT0184207.1 LacI family DNA-binding transcriptional regulator [Microbacterium sp. ARD31]